MVTILAVSGSYEYRGVLSAVIQHGGNWFGRKRFSVLAVLFRRQAVTTNYDDIFSAVMQHDGIWFGVIGGYFISLAGT